jgi:hypothetical protein
MFVAARGPGTVTGDGELPHRRDERYCTSTDPCIPDPGAPWIEQ